MDGYVLVYDKKGRYKPEHRVIMERYLGRRLLQSEQVHHKDGNRGNNAIDNLEVWDRYTHGLLHN